MVSWQLERSLGPMVVDTYGVAEMDPAIESTRVMVEGRVSTLNVSAVKQVDFIAQS